MASALEQTAGHTENIGGRMRDYARAHGYALDRAQRRAVKHFQRLSDDLVANGKSATSGMSMLRRLLPGQRDIAGIYLWGGVGRGKSFLMDAFFSLVKIEQKRRIHFHRFMQEIHHTLRDLQGTAEPVAEVAKNMASKARLLCLDEFHVVDIGDAMLMRRLLEGLFEQGVAIVGTSNRHPDQLYQDGLQRSQFLPAIELLKARLDVVNVDAGIDYRLRALEKVEIYHQPLDDAAGQNLARSFHAIAGEEGVRDYQLEIEGRALRARRHADGVVWFDFDVLCDGPRGQADYIELAEDYHTVLLSGIPQFGPEDGDRRRRFTWLIDEFYDRRVKLIASAAVTVDRLCTGQAGIEFERTVSRLIEMQTREYLGREHLS